MKMAWEGNITLEASLAFERMEGKVFVILEKPEICYELKYITNAKFYNVNLTFNKQEKSETLVKAEEAP